MLETSVNRRTFLAGAGAGTAALALGRGARGAGPNDRIRVAVIGIRGRGLAHLSAFASKDSQVATICDVDSRLFDARARLVEAKTGRRPQCVQDLRRVLDDKDIDVV